MIPGNQRYKCTMAASLARHFQAWGSEVAKACLTAFGAGRGDGAPRSAVAAATRATSFYLAINDDDSERVEEGGAVGAGGTGRERAEVGAERKDAGGEGLAGIKDSRVLVCT